MICKLQQPNLLWRRSIIIHELNIDKLGCVDRTIMMYIFAEFYNINLSTTICVTVSTTAFLLLSDCEGPESGSAWPELKQCSRARQGDIYQQCYASVDAILCFRVQANLHIYEIAMTTNIPIHASPPVVNRTGTASSTTTELEEKRSGALTLSLIAADGPHSSWISLTLCRDRLQTVA